MDKQTILLVEDDPMIADAMIESLSAAGFDVQAARSGWEATGMLSQKSFGMVLLDLGLPGKDGMTVLAELRAKDAATPVIILTARDALQDRLAGLDAGADDYVVKPFHVSEVIARMRAVWRGRLAHGARSGSQEAGTILTNGVLALDCSAKTVTVKSRGQAGERTVALSKREYALLEALLRRPGAILSRDRLEECIYGQDDEMPESNALEFILHGLRKKLGAGIIGNVRGLGWMVQKRADG